MMKQFEMLAFGFAFVLAYSSTACTATPVKPNRFTLESDKSLDIVKQTAINAMIVHGFEITQNSDTYIEGHRPRTWGFFCTPGGEGAGVWLEQTNPSLTRAWINSEKSSFGMACQKNWTGPIYLEMKKGLETGM